MAHKIIPLVVAGIISASYLGANAQDAPKDTSQVVQQDSIYVQKSQADSLKKGNPNILELSVKETQIGKKTKIQLFYVNPNNSKIRGSLLIDNKKDLCKKLSEAIPKSKEPRRIVYTAGKETPLLNNGEVEDLMKCLDAEKYWIYRGDYFWD